MGYEFTSEINRGIEIIHIAFEQLRNDEIETKLPDYKVYQLENAYRNFDRRFTEVTEE